MKKSLILPMLVFGLGLLLCVACTKKDDEPAFNETMLVGKWQRPSTLTSGTDNYRYDADHTGATWDTGDDVTEEEEQPFTWKLESDTLTLLHQGEMGEVIPKVYIVTTLNATELIYEDDYAKTYEFTKVTE